MGNPQRLTRAQKLKYAIKTLHEHDKLFIYKWFDKCCAYCGVYLQMKDIEYDHIHSVMGEDQDDFWFLGTSPANIVCSCKSCNRSKSNKLLEDWLPNKFENHGTILQKIYEYQAEIGTPYE